VCNLAVKLREREGSRSLTVYERERARSDDYSRRETPCGGNNCLCSRNEETVNLIFVVTTGPWDLFVRNDINRTNWQLAHATLIAFRASLSGYTRDKSLNINLIVKRAHLRS